MILGLVGKFPLCKRGILCFLLHPIHFCVPGLSLTVSNCVKTIRFYIWPLPWIHQYMSVFYRLYSKVGCNIIMTVSPILFSNLINLANSSKVLWIRSTWPFEKLWSPGAFTTYTTYLFFNKEVMISKLKDVSLWQHIILVSGKEVHKLGDTASTNCANSRISL